MPHPTRNLDVPAPRLPHARLLVVDDDQLIRELHARVLIVAGYEVETAEDGVDALERLAKEPFDLVVTDNYMPRLSGSNIALTLRSAGSRIPVVMVSGSLATTPLPAGVAREVFAALRKPARSAEVVSAVALALSSSAQAAGDRSIRRLQYLEA